MNEPGKIETKIDVRNNLIFRKCVGDIKINDIITSFQDIILSNDYKQNMNGIWDFRDANLLFDMEDLKKFSSIITKMKDKIGNKHKIVLWTSNKNDYLLSTLGLAITKIDSLPFDLKILTYEFEILNWLELEKLEIDYA